MNIPSNSSSIVNIFCFISLLSNQILEIFVLRLGMDWESCMEGMLFLEDGSELKSEFILF